ncbi:MAG: endonuclease/exonuclease/phosphatase family protein [Phycisphaerales bacterium]|nr:endonuclease/exonuclease/phosphatase family protein [Phycisphaerales bacterium]
MYKTLPLTLLVCLSSSLAIGCQSIGAPPKSTDANPTTHLPPHLLDGSFTEWTQPNTGNADGRYIYLHFSPVGDFPHSIQAAPHTTRIRIDADLNPQTGHPMRTMSLEAAIQRPQGVDVLLELSPKNELGSVGIGSQVTLFKPDGHLRFVGHADLGFMFLPTYGTNEYEARIDRLAPESSILPESGVIEVIVDQISEDDRLMWSTTFRVELPKLDRSIGSDATIAAKPKKSVRVMSSNVLFSSPLKEPKPFKRVLDAINPDVILYQEWFNTPIDQVEGWLNTYAGKGWSVHMPSSKAGVAIATRHRIIKTYESVIPPSNTGRPARGVAALIDTDAGELLAISIHLKCCGSADSSEDNKRIDQAKSINAFVRSVHKNHPNAKVVIAGDFNLVGSRKPLTVMANALGINGEDLSPVQAQQLGDASMITWNDEKSRFSPGRLDWMLIDESMSTAANAFILDTRALSAASLHAMGLEANDSKASDHLPIVIDLVDAN